MVSANRYETTRRAKLIGYFIRDEYGLEPTTENIEAVLNDDNIDNIIDALDRNLSAAAHLRLHQETLDVINNN